MAADTPISWADDTSSPWWGCTKVSRACEHCYAETMAARFGRGSWGPQGERAIRVDACLADLARFARRGMREGRPRRVFLGSMCDVFEQRPDLVEPRRALWDGLHALSDGPLASGIHVLVLTKRAEEMARYAAGRGWPGVCWAGVTAEDQERADERIPHLLRVPARVRFVSAEPLLGMISLDRVPFRPGVLNAYDGSALYIGDEGGADYAWSRRQMLDLVIGGGESGRNARPVHPDWARSLRDQCAAAGVAWHWKQNGEFIHTSDTASWGPGCDRPVADYPQIPDGEGGIWLRVGRRAAGRLLDGRTHDDIPEVTR